MADTTDDFSAFDKVVAESPKDDFSAFDNVVKKKVFSEPSPLKSNVGDSTSTDENSASAPPSFGSIKAETKQKANDVIVEKTKQNFASLPQFAPENPNAEKNKQIYIDTLKSKGYDVSLKPQSAADNLKQGADQGAGEPTNESQYGVPQVEQPKEINLATKAVDAIGGYIEKSAQGIGENTVKGAEGLSEMMNAKTPSEALTGGLKGVAGVGNAALAMIPEAQMFMAGMEAAKGIAEKTLSKENADKFNYIADAPFTIGTKLLDKLGFDTQKEGNAKYVGQMLDFVGGALVLGGAHEGAEGVKDFHTEIKKIAQGDSKVSLDNLTKQISEISIDDIKKQAEKSDTPESKDIVNKIDNIVPFVHPELEALHKEKEDWQKANISPEEKATKIAEVDQKIDNHINIQGDKASVEGLINVGINDIDTKIKTEQDKVAANPDNTTVKQDSENNIQQLNDQKKQLTLKLKENAIQEQSAGSVLQHPQTGVGETGGERTGVEPSQQGTETTQEGQAKTETTVPPNDNNVTYVHHGEDTRDKAEQVGGTEDTMSTEKGVKDAEKATGKLDHVKQIISSHIARAKETAHIIGEKLGLTPKEHEGLGSWKIGDFDGMDRKLFSKAEKYFIDNPDAKTLPDTPEFKDVPKHELPESFGEFKDRVVKTDAELKSDPQYKDAAVVTHSKNIKILRAIKKNGGWNDQAKADYLNDKVHSAEVEEQGSTKLTHEETEAKRKELGMEDKPTVTPESAEELSARADEVIKNGYDVEGLIAEIKNDNERVPSKLEHTILQKYYGGLEEKMKTASPEEMNDLIDKARKAVEASDKGGSAAGSALQARQNTILNDDSLLSFFVRESEINNGAELTENQKAQVQKEYNELKEAKKKVDANNIRLQEENTKLKAEQKLKESSRKQKVDRRSLKIEDIKKERASLLDQLQKEWKGDKNEPTKMGSPISDKMVVIIAQIAHGYVREGAIKIEGIADKVYEDVKDIVGGITKRDIQSILAGEYGEKKATQTRGEAQKQLADFRTEMKLIDKYEKLKEGIEPKTEKKLRERNKEIADLQKQIKEHDLTRLAAKKTRLKTSIEKIEADLKSGDFLKEKAKPEPVKLDKQAQDDVDKLIRLRNEREIRIIKDQYANRTKWQKAKDTAMEVGNIPRGIMASMDYSAPLRQGLLPTIAHPILASRAMGEMFKQSFSQKRFDRWFHDLRESDEFPTMKESSLYIADPHNPKLSAKEEQFMNNLAEKIPVIGKLVKGSERAYVSYLNKMRVDLFKQGQELLESNGKTLENSKQDYKALASWVNNSTGRGELGVTLEKAAPVLNMAFFSPRLIASRINLLNPAYYAKLPKEVRVSAIKDMLKLVAFSASVLALAKANGAKVEDDPRSSDFGKIVVGNTRYDILGGFAQYIRFFSQMTSGQTKSTKTGKIQKLDGKGAFGATRLDVLKRFSRGKLAPIPGSAIDLMEGRDVVGQPVTVKSKAESLFTPLLYQDVKDAYKDKGLKSAIPAGLASMFGVGVNTYKKKK